MIDPKVGMSTITVIALLVCQGCDADRMSTDNPVWTLVRGSSPEAYVATFDDVASENHTHCESLRDRLQRTAKPGETYRCIVGRMGAKGP